MTITEIKLNSPFHDDCQATFNCHFNNSLNDEAYDIVKIIRFISHDYSDLENLLANNPDAIKTFDNLKNLLNDFNKWIEENKSSIKQTRNRQASNELIRYLMLLIYNRAVLDPDKLNHYEPFSPQVYGETSFDLIEQMLKRVKLNENDVFMDLGSGVGNVVLQVAALNSCKRCYGFEKAEWPAYYASKMEKEFKFWMKFFDKSYSDFKLYKADFLSDEEYVDETKTKTMNEYVKEIINESNLIFVNNYAFGAEVDHQLKLRFCNMLEGAIIVSSKPFCSLNFRINPRNLNDIGTMLNIDFEPPLNGQVSWTDKPINYYFHKIDRTLLEKYFESKKNPTIEIESHKCKHSKSHSPSSVSSASSLSPSTSPSSSPSSSSSSTSSYKKKSRKLDDDEDTDELPRRGRKKKRKQSPSNENKLQSNSLLCKKRAKLIKNKTKLLNKEQLNTLNKMHSEVCHKLKKQDTKFNDPTMTSLKDENLSKQLLKDCKISPKLIPKKQACELGDDVNEAIDLYLKKLKRHYVDYLTYMKNGTEFQDKIKQEIKQESKKKANNLYQIEKWEKKINDVLKQDVMLLKQRAEEVGISCLESPQQLMDQARQMLENHHKLIEKMNKIQNEINSLEIKQTDLKPTQFNTSNIRLKNTFDSLKKLSSYFNSNQKLDLSNLIKNSTEECFNQRNSEVRSVESNRSTDETLTATEKGDDEMDDDDLDYLNDEELKDTNKKLKHKPKIAVSTQQQVSSVVKYEKLLDQETTNQNWRNFKIPKKTNSDETQKAQGPHTPPGSPTLSTSSTSSSANSLQANSNSAINTETQKFSSLNENQSIQVNYDYANQQQYQQKQSNYYHPKKNQFRQYMMENSTGSSSYSDQPHLNKY